MIAEPDRAAVEAVASSTESATKLVLAGEMEAAERALGRAEAALAELKARLPWHSRIVRQSEDLIRLARRTRSAPRRQENEETGLIDRARERLARRTLRAAERVRA